MTESLFVMKEKCNLTAQWMMTHDDPKVRELGASLGEAAQRLLAPKIKPKNTALDVEVGSPLPNWID